MLLINTSKAQLATEPLRVDPTAVIEKGSVAGTSIITDDFGQVFIEIPERTYIAHKNDQTAFSGEIMPPKEITIPDQTPKTRMREIFSFELVSDSGETLVFSDKINTLQPRQRLRLERLNDGNPLEGAPKPKLIFIIDNPEVQSPKLWRFIDKDTGWQRIGGLMKELDESRRIFSVYINQTGKYSLIDEDPAPIEIPAEMREATAYESIESIEERIQSLEQIRAEIVARDQGLLFNNESGFSPEFLSEDFDLDSMTDAEFFDAFFADEDFPDLEEGDNIDSFDSNNLDENAVIPSIDSQVTETIPAEFLENDTPLPALNPDTLSPIEPLTETRPTTPQNDPLNQAFPDEINAIEISEPKSQNPTTNNISQSTDNQTLPAELPATGETTSITQTLWDGFKAVFILLILLAIPGYFVWEKMMKTT